MSFDGLLQQSEEVDLSEDDLRKILGFNVKIISYDELRHENTVENILGPQGVVIILYQIQNSFGHWVALFKTGNNTLEFFDPYGLKYDDELKLEKFNWRDESTGKGHLSHILERSRYKIIWNRVVLQQKRSHINTCGRHVAVRLKFRKYSLDQYVKMMRTSKYSPDMLVSALTLLFSF